MVEEYFSSRDYECPVCNAHYVNFRSFLTHCDKHRDDDLHLPVHLERALVTYYRSLLDWEEYPDTTADIKSTRKMRVALEEFFRPDIEAKRVTLVL